MAIWHSRQNGTVGKVVSRKRKYIGSPPQKKKSTDWYSANWHIPEKPSISLLQLLFKPSAYYFVHYPNIKTRSFTPLYFLNSLYCRVTRHVVCKKIELVQKEPVKKCAFWNTGAKITNLSEGTYSHNEDRKHQIIWSNSGVAWVPWPEDRVKVATVQNRMVRHRWHCQVKVKTYQWNEGLLVRLGSPSAINQQMWARKSLDFNEKRCSAGNSRPEGTSGLTPSSSSSANNIHDQSWLLLIFLVC